MLGTFALLGTLLTIPAQDKDKVNFAHNFTKDQTVAYELNFKGGGGGSDREMNVAFTILFGEKEAKGTSVTVSPKSVKMTQDGETRDQSGVGDMKFILDEHGMPDSISMNGDSVMLVIPLVLSYLPNKELAVGDTFDINYDQSGTTFKGTGKYDGIDKANDKSLPKLTIKAALNPGGEGEGQLEYAIFFDKESGHIALLKGKADVETQQFNFVLTKK